MWKKRVSQNQKPKRREKFLGICEIMIKNLVECIHMGTKRKKRGRSRGKEKEIQREMRRHGTQTCEKDYWGGKRVRPRGKKEKS